MLVWGWAWSCVRAGEAPVIGSCTASTPCCHGHSAPRPMGWSLGLAHPVYERLPAGDAPVSVGQHPLYPQASCLGLSESGNWSTSRMLPIAEPTWAICVTLALPTEMWVYAHTCPSAPSALVPTLAAPGAGEGSSAELGSPVQHVTQPDRRALRALGSHWVLGPLGESGQAFSRAQPQA